MIAKTLTVMLLVLLIQTPTKKEINTGQRELAACRVENKQLSETIRSLKDQVTTFNQQLNSLNEQLTAAKSEVEKCRAQIERLSGGNKDLSALQEQLNDARQQLQACQQESRRLSVLNAGLNNQLTELRGSKGETNLDQQLAAAKQEVERCKGQNAQLSNQLRDLQVRLTNFDQQLNAARQETERYKSQDAQISNQLRDLEQRLANQDQQFLATNKELQTSKQTVSDLTKQVLAQGQSPKNPEAVLALAQSSQLGIQRSEALISTYEENGKIHVIRELVIGTLKTVYEKEVKPGSPFPLKAIFKPHPIIKPGTLKGAASEEAITWYIELQYPSQKSQASYDERQSGQKPPKRAIDPNGGEETWIWSVNPPANFESDVSDLIVFAEYKMGEQAGRKDIVHEDIKFTQVREPSAFAKAIGLFKENLNYILGVLSVGIAIWGGVIKIKCDKLEMRLKEKAQA